MDLQQHPLSAAFPSMPDGELGALAIDIEAHGQREPGVLYEGMVLDGWHRYLACRKVGREFKAVELNGEDPIAFVLSRNLHRRHLTASQRAAAVVAAHNWKPLGSNQHGVGEGRNPVPTLTEKQMAEEAEVTTRTIRQAKAAHEAGLGDAVRDGMLSVKEAAQVATGKTPEEKKPRVIVAGAKVEAEYNALKAAYEEALEKNAELGDIARELDDKLTAYQTTEPDEQQKLIAELQLKVRRKDAEIDRQRVQIRDLNNKCNELIRTVKRLQKNAH